MDELNDQETRTTGIGVVGAGADADRWARAIRGVAGAAVRRIGASDADLLACLSDDTVLAIALVPPLAELAGIARRVLAAGRHLIVTGPGAMSSDELMRIDALARARRLVAMFDDGTAGDPRIAFVRKMTRGAQAIWRPRYVRSLHTGGADASIDEVAIADIGAVLSLLAGVPSRVSAVAPRVDDETGATDVAMVTMMYDGGAIASVDVSLIEDEPRNEITVACAGRTIVLDAFDARAPLRIHGGRHRGPERGAPWRETVSEHPLVDAHDRTPAVAESFVQAVRGRDTALSNASEVALAADVWECARASISAGGESVDVTAQSTKASRPELRLIHGAGDGRTASGMPRLRVVGGGPQQSAPLHSA